jgi:hypothetical protein
MSNLTKEDLITALTSLMVRHRQRTELRDGRFVPSTKEDLELYATQYSNWLRLFRVEQLEDMFMDKLTKLAGE